MTRIQRVLVVILAISLLVPGPVLAVTDDPSDPANQCISADQQNADPTTTVTVSNPDDDTGVVRMSYDSETLPADFSIRLPPDAELTDQSGFKRKNERVYIYNGSSAPYVDFQLLNTGLSQTTSGGWAFTPKPIHSGARVRYDAVPNGVVGDQFIYIGNYTSVSESVGCHTVRLVVSESSRDQIDSREVLDDVVYTGNKVDIGHRYEDVTIFAIPHPIDARYGGYALANEAWINPSTDSGRNSVIAIHEYLHTRSVLDATGIQGMLWFTEGSVHYLALKTAHERRAIGGNEYNQKLKDGATQSASLTNRSSWSGTTEYLRGAVFVAILDHKLRAATGGEYTVVDMMRQINNVESPSGTVNLDRERFLDRIANNSNQSVADWANSSIDTEQSLNHELAKVDVRYLQLVKDNIAEGTRENPLHTGLYLLFLGSLLGVASANTYWKHFSEDSDSEE